MKKLWTPLVAMCVVLSGVTALASPAAADTGSDEMAFVQKLNELRASHGLAALGTKGELFDMARAWSGRMAAAGAISHNPHMAAQAPSNWARIGENVGVGGDVQSLHNAFVASPLHFKNMIDPGFESVGVGVVHGPGGIIYVTVNFMRAHVPAAQIVQAAAPAAPVAQAAVAQATTKKVCTKSRKTKKVSCRTVKARKAPVKARRARR